MLYWPQENITTFTFFQEECHPPAKSRARTTSSQQQGMGKLLGLPSADISERQLHVGPGTQWPDDDNASTTIY